MVWEDLEGFGEVREGPAYVRTVQGTSGLGVAAAVAINEPLVPPKLQGYNYLEATLRFFSGNFQRINFLVTGICF